jgi:RNA polymerase sigma factor (sigma-70 family)
MEAAAPGGIKSRFPVKPVTPPARIHPEAPQSGEVDSDELLMERFCSGDSGAFDALFRRHAKMVHAFLTRLSGTKAAADDLTQTAFLSVVRARARFRRGAAFKPWLYAIAANAARDLRRRRRDESTEDGEVAANLAAESPEPRDTGLENAVRSALTRLPEKYRETIVLHRYEGLSFTEIAEVLDVPVGTAKIRAHRGYEQLREMLRGVWEET